MDALETLVRDTLVDHAADAPSDDRLLAAVTAAPRGRPWLAGGLAAAMVVAIAVGALVLGNARHHDVASTTQAVGGDCRTGGLPLARLPEHCDRGADRTPSAQKRVPSARAIHPRPHWRSPMVSCVEGGLPRGAADADRAARFVPDPRGSGKTKSDPKDHP